MKQKIFTFLLIAAGLSACKKENNQVDVKTFDQQQIQTYLTANKLTDLTKDENTGIHYKIINPGSGDSIKYADEVTIVYSVKSIDGKYASVDTITNHFYSYLGQLNFTNSTTGFRFPNGLQLAIHDILKYKGGSMRLIIPSNLAYGINGLNITGGSSTNANSRIAGNQSLDYYVHVIGDQDAYDDSVIKNFISTKNLSGFVKDPLGYYYKINTQPTGTVGEIKEFSNLSLTYTGYLLNDVSFDITNQTTAITFTPFGTVDAVKDALIKHCAAGTNITLLVPSSLGYKTAAQGSIPPSSVLKFDFNIGTVTQP